MNSLLLINNLNCSLLKNAEHVQYHTNIMNVIEGVDAETMGLSELVYGPYTSAIMEEQDIVYNATGSAYTQLMQEADVERCNAYRRIFRKLTVCEFENSASTAFKAWPVVSKNLVDPYGMSVTSLAMQEKTAVITGFIKDCREILTSEQVSSIGIDGDLDDLQMANQKFERMYQERIAEKESRELGANATYRATTDACWKHVYTMLNALANDPTVANAGKRQAAQEAVRKINVITEEARQRLTFRLKANKAFIDKTLINGEETLTLPLPMEEISSITLEGNKLTVDNVKVTVLEKGSAGTSKHKTYTVAEFVDRYDGTCETSKDESTDVETMVISGFTIGSYVAVTIESIDINA